MGTFDLTSMWHSTGPLARAVIVMLGLMSIYSIYVSIERLMRFLRVRKNSLQFVSELDRLLEQHDLDGAIRRSKATPQPPVARVVGAALEEYAKSRETGSWAGVSRATWTEADNLDLVELVQLAITRERDREVSELRKGLGSLASIATTAPFVGLFGTVVGIINAFQAMATSGQGGLGAVSAGIAEALATTAFGLLVAIPAVLTYNHLTGRLEELVVDLNEVASHVVAFILRRRPTVQPRLDDDKVISPPARNGRMTPSIPPDSVTREMGGDRL